MTMTALDRRKIENLSPGDSLPGGIVFGGLSPDTGKPFFAAAADESAPMGWEDANRTAVRKSADGNRWRLATEGEWTVLRRNRDKGALAGTFNEAGWYWTAHEVNRRKARTLNPKDGTRNDDFKFRPSLVRLVRD